MSRFRLEIRITPRRGLLDPEGKAIHHALGNLGYDEVAEVRVGRVLLVELAADSPEHAAGRADEMCRKLLANPVTEDFEVGAPEEVPASPAADGAPAGDGS